MSEELSSRHVLHEHVEMLRILGEALEVYNEGMWNRTQYLILVGDVVHLLRLDKFDFFHNLYARILVGIFFLDQSDCPERAWIDEMLPSPKIVR